MDLAPSSRHCPVLVIDRSLIVVLGPFKHCHLDLAHNPDLARVGRRQCTFLDHFVDGVDAYPDR